MIKKLICALSVAAMMLQPAVSAMYRQTIPSAREFSDEKYIFKIDGSNQRFLLVDESDSYTSKFFVVAIDYYGSKVWHASGSDRFDPQDPESMAYYLNNDFIKFGYTSKIAGRTYKLPEQIIDHVDFEHEWDCEWGKLGGDAPNDYKIKCGIAIPSQEELKKYADKIGWDDNFASRDNDFNPLPWAVRSTDYGGYIVCARPSIDKTMLNTFGRTWGAIGVRPCFWLDTDFFKEVKLDLNSMGSRVKDVFKKYYTIDEMSELYSKQECYDYMGYTPELTLTMGEKSVTISNNRFENENGVMVVTYFSEGDTPVATGGCAVYLNSKEIKTQELTINAPEDAIYARVKIVSGMRPFETLSNSLKINL